MPHIDLPREYPGIRSLFMFRPQTAAPLNLLAQTLLHDPHPSLSQGERELIATYVSSLNECNYCASTHGAIARHHLGDQSDVVRQVRDDPEQAELSPRMKALLHIAGKVQQGGKKVTTQDIDKARHEGASDIDLHDTVLIAAAFCMFNRYVDGLATWQPDDPELYNRVGKQRAAEGYLTPPFKVGS